MKIKRTVFRFVPRRMRHIFNLQVASEVEGKPLTSPLKNGKALDGHWLRSWKTEIIERMCRARDGAFVDIGANIGQTMLDHYLTGVAAPYIGFEPNPSCVSYLNDIIAANSFDRHTILPIGLANETKVVPLYTRRGHAEDDAASLVADLRPQWAVAAQYVSCHRFDDVRAALDLKQIAFVKIDVEGFELEVLKGMRETLGDLRPVVLCEILFTDAHADLAVNERRNRGIEILLGELDYKIFQLIKSPDDLRIVDAKKIEHLSNEILTRENFQLFDYLFVPASEEIEIVKRLLEKAPDSR